MTRYHIDSNKLRQIIAQRGYAHLTEFARTHGFNRATLNHYLKGQGPFSESYYAICDALSVDPVSLLMPSANAPTNHLDEIMPIVKKLCAYDKGIAAVLLGSRAKKTHKKYSDWDIGVTRGTKPISDMEFLKLRRIADDAADDLPREVDVVNLDAAPQWFINDIDYEPVYLAGDSNAWAYFMGVLHGTRKQKKN